MPTKARWQCGDFFLLAAIEYQPESGRILVRYRNGDVGEAPASALWKSRIGEPDWSKARIDPDTSGALLVPTRPGRPTLEGDIAEIPGDVIRAVTDIDYRAEVTREAANWARRVGQALSRLREARQLTCAQAAEASGLAEWMIVAIESGRVEVSQATFTCLVTAMGATMQDCPGPVKDRRGQP